jgi:hypothetical protein
LLSRKFQISSHDILHDIENIVQDNSIAADTKATMCTDLFQKKMYAIAEQVLGSRPHNTRDVDKGKVVKLDKKRKDNKTTLMNDELASTRKCLRLLKSLRRMVNIIYNPNSQVDGKTYWSDYNTSSLGPPTSINDPRTKKAINCLRIIHKIPLPLVSDPGHYWLAWVADKAPSLIADAINSMKKIDHDMDTIPDTLSHKNPKYLFRNTVRPYTDHKITAFNIAPNLNTKPEVITDPIQINDYLKNHYATPTFSIPVDDRIEDDKKMSTEPEDLPGWLKPIIPSSPITGGDLLMSHIDKIEIKNNIKHMNSDTGAGHDGINPAVIKTIATTPYKITSDPDDNGERSITWYKPTNVLTILEIILNLYMDIRDIPSCLKFGVITPIPKKGKQVNHISNIRPITVTPILSRMVNKIIATRLIRHISKNNLIHKAQHAFLSGGNIHDPINTLLAVWEHANNKFRKNKTKMHYNKARKQTNSRKNGCYNIFYDISKAYDSVSWSSIVLSMKRLLLPDALIQWVINTLKGSQSVIKTGLGSNGTTEVFDIHKGIHQGDPLAPILFIIVMDPLHRGYQFFKGYDLSSSDCISSSGYADDTWLTNSDLFALKLQHSWTHEFMDFHGMDINTSKTLFVGKHADGSPATDDSITIWWDRIKKSNNHNLDPPMTQITIISPEISVRYLGIYANMDMDWNTQISKMDIIILSTTRKLQPYTVTLNQANMVIKQVTAPRLDIGLRHAQIPNHKLRQWDTIITRAIKRCAVGRDDLNPAATASILNINTISSLYYAVNASELFLRLVTQDNMSEFHLSQYKDATSRINRTGNTTALKFNRMVRTLKNLKLINFSIEKNNHHHHHLKPQSYKPCDRAMKEGKILSFNDNPVPLLHSYHLWKNHANPRHCRSCKDHSTNTDTVVYIATDGSTPTTGNSGSGFVVMDDVFRAHKGKKMLLYCSYKIKSNNNYHAELSPLNSALFLPPVTTPVSIVTDSLNSITAINNLLTKPTTPRKLARLNGRPYIIRAVRGIITKKAYGAPTNLIHIHSHNADDDSIESIANDCADEKAKEALSIPDNEAVDFDPLDSELPYVLIDSNNKICMDDTILEIKQAFKKFTLDKWKNSSPSSTNALINSVPPKVFKTYITRINKFHPNISHYKRLALLAITQSLPTRHKKGSHYDPSKDNICLNCSWNATETTNHVLMCPAFHNIREKTKSNIQSLIFSSPKEEYKIAGSYSSITSLNDRVRLTLNDLKLDMKYNRDSVTVKSLSDPSCSLTMNFSRLFLLARRFLQHNHHHETPVTMAVISSTMSKIKIHNPPANNYTPASDNSSPEDLQLTITKTHNTITISEVLDKIIISSCTPHESTINLPSSLVDPLRSYMNLHSHAFSSPLTFYSKFSDWYTTENHNYARYLGAHPNNNQALANGKYTYLQTTGCMLADMLENEDYIREALDGPLPTRFVIALTDIDHRLPLVQYLPNYLIHPIFEINVPTDRCYNYTHNKLTIDIDSEPYTNFRIILLENRPAAELDPIDLNLLHTTLVNMNKDAKIIKNIINHTDMWPGLNQKKKRRSHGNYSHWHLHSEKDTICQWFNPLIPQRPKDNKIKLPIEPNRIPQTIQTFNRHAGILGMIPSDFCALLEAMDIHLEDNIRKSITDQMHRMLREMATEILLRWEHLNRVRDNT